MDILNVTNGANKLLMRILCGYFNAFYEENVSAHSSAKAYLKILHGVMRAHVS